MIKQQVDYLIVGQGIAGTLFANELLQHGREFVVIDPDLHNASKVAAGMYNPVILKRFSMVWNAASQMATLHTTFAQLAQRLHTQFNHPLTIQRIFHSEKERQTWQKKAQSSGLGAFLDSQLAAAEQPTICAPYGLGNVNWGGRVDLKSFLKAFRAHLQQSQKIRTENFDYHALEKGKNHLIYKDIMAKHIVFCEGYGAKQNPFFPHLPLKGNKGERLIVRIPKLKLRNVIKSGVFIMPQPELGDDVYYLGATYDRDDKTGSPSPSARETLLQKLSDFIKIEAQVLDHSAGIRPTVIDRRPLVGRCPDSPSLYLLNGLGTRGVMLGASMAKQLYHFIEDGAPLAPDVNIARFSPPEKS